MGALTILVRLTSLVTIKRCVHPGTPEERAEVPAKLTSSEEIAAAVARFVEEETHAGRVLVWWSGEPPSLVPVDRE